MRFNSVKRGNFSGLARSVNQNADAIFKAARDTAVDNTAIAKEAIKGRSMERRAAMEAEGRVARAGLEAFAKTKDTKNKVESAEKINDIKRPAKRMAGVVAGLGALSQAALAHKEMQTTKKERAEERAERDRIFTLMQQNNAELRAEGDKVTQQLEAMMESFKTDKPTPPPKPGESSNDGSNNNTSGDTTPPNSPPTSVPAPTSLKPGAVLSKAQLATYAREAGFPESEISTAVAVAMGESGGKIDAYNGKGNDDSYGLMQINMIDKPGYQLGTERRGKFGLKSNSELNDPQTNMNAAYQIWKGSGWKAWGAYTNGSYQDHL